ncbi:MAG: DUF362 domain-containing protein [Deltaproteobacteria bacterium]|nr:DUF362 domain-containing protein [Deltaproteobacteria bacterium]
MKKVALVKGDDRKTNIRQALELVSDDIDLKGRRPVIKVNFVSTYMPLSATHPDATRAVVEFLKDRGEKDIIVAEGATLGTTSRGFREYGYLDLAREYDLELIDLNEPDSWKVVFVMHPDMKPHPVKLAQTMVDPNNYIISVTCMKSHLQVGVTLTAKNVIMGAIMIMDKVRMHPTEAGNRMLDYNLFTVMQHLHIDLGVLDGFEGMEGDGPLRGEPVDHRLALAGTDYLAVDRVGTEVMGADFDNIRYLNYLWDWGFGEGDLSKIQVIGETIESCRKQYRMAPRFLKMRRQESKGQYQEIADTFV